MDDPLEADMIPTEMIVTDEVEYTVFGITAGKDISEFVNIVYPNSPKASYSVMDGTARVVFDMYGVYSVECVIRGQNLALPDEASATASDRDAWAEKYLLHPTGKIAQIRVSLMQ